jgi:hypothetical protein
MEFLTVLLIVVVLIVWTVTRSRLRRMERRIDELQAADRHRAELTRRVYELEQAIAGLSSPIVQTPEIDESPEVDVGQGYDLQRGSGPPVEPETPLPAEGLPHIVPERGPVITEEPQPAPEPVAAGPTWAERLRESMGGKEWEAIVGGSLLNKLGVLVLIIGIALFLGYSFTKMGPAGRVLTATAVSAAMLAGGVLLERRSGYRVFATGLIGGGWAGLYFTAYAAHAVDAARIVESPWLASILLTAVSVGMIIHSLKFRSQTVTGLAYFIAFATLALTPVTAFSVLALLPLAASLMYLAHRFSWYRMGLFGVFATYAVCASRGDSGASVAATQSIIGAYWLLFEAFTLLRASRPGPFAAPEQFIFPMNTLGVIALSVPKWHHAAPRHLYLFLAAAALVHIVGAAIRWRLRPPAEDPEPNILRRIASAGYEGPVTIAAALLVFAMFQRFTTVWINAGLVIEAELFVLAGLWLRQAYLHRLGAAVFGVATAKLLINDAEHGALVQYGRWSLREWSPVALISAALMYWNRRLIARAVYFSYGATLAVALVLGYELSRLYVTAGWLASAAVLLEIGLRRRALDFRIQCYALAVIAVGAVVANNVPVGSQRHAWIPAMCTAALGYWITFRLTRAAAELHLREGRFATLGLSWITTACAMLFAVVVAPEKFMGGALVLLAGVMVELGLRVAPSHFRWLAYIPLAAGYSHVLVNGVFDASKTMTLVERLNLAVSALVSYGISIRELRRRYVHIIGTAFATLFSATLLWVALPHAVVAVAWALLSLALIEGGALLESGVLRFVGDLLGGAVVVRLFLANFVNNGVTAGISHRLLTITPIIAQQYYAWKRRRLSDARWERRISRLYLYVAPLLAVFLIRFELGLVLTVTGWAALMLLLFWLGIRHREFDFRLQSCAVAALCFWRSWTTNFYVPDSFSGVWGRIGIAAIVVAALHAAEFLAPREPVLYEGAGRWRRFIDQYARPYFALLAAALVSVLVYYEVSGGMLTVSWGVQASVLLAAGFAFRERVLRLAGLLLFLNCILKLFLYDLRHLETMNRILSFIVLGAVMVGVSWIYTRFRAQIQKYL